VYETLWPSPVPSPHLSLRNRLPALLYPRFKAQQSCAIGSKARELVQNKMATVRTVNYSTPINVAAAGWRGQL
jgi:hypothetical protein